MEKRRIGSLEVTIIGVGCNNFGRDLDEARTREVVQAALDAGVTFFDTANGYGRPRGTSERYLGSALGSRRDEVVIATKFGPAIESGESGALPANVKLAAEESLERLGTDRIDLYQLHRPDKTVPIAETLGALSELVEEGKVLEIGCSNFSVAQLREAATAVAPGNPAFVSVQNEYSVLNRYSDLDVLPECRRTGIGFLPYFPLYAGLLTGKYKRGERPPEGSRMLTDFYTQVRDAVFSDHNFDVVEQLSQFAESRGHTVLELAFAWLLAEQQTPSVIAGVSSPRQVQANVAAASWVLTPDDLTEIDRIAPSPTEPGGPDREHLFSSYFRE